LPDKDGLPELSRLPVSRGNRYALRSIERIDGRLEVDALGLLTESRQPENVG
jgi:hypothetical protein